MPSVGDVIAGKYRLDRLVGAGGMGVVYAGTHIALAQSVAVKFVRANPADKESATLRLIREARAVAQLTSEHVARVQDVGALEDGSAFLVMELLEGTTLQELVNKGGRLSLAEASEAAIQVCHALGDAHAHGIVHRDVKPSNLFVVRDASLLPRVKVIDFGVSKALRGVEDASSMETKTGSLLGSPPFMSPEQIRAASEVDARTDIWSLGVVLYFLVCGRMPFAARSLLDLMTLIAYEDAPSIREACPGVPEAFEEVVARCLAKRREDRYASAAALAEALVPFAPARAHWIAARVLRAEPQTYAAERAASAELDASIPVDIDATASRASKPPPQEVATVDGVASAHPPLVPPRRPRRAIAGAAVIAGVVVSILAVVGIMRSSRSHDRAETPSAPLTAAPGSATQPALEPAHPGALSSAAPRPAVSANAEASVAANPTPEPLAPSGASARASSSAAPPTTASAAPSGRAKTPRIAPHPRSAPRNTAPVLPTTPD